MKVLTAAQMREVDRRTAGMGIPGIVLMENAGHRVVELLAERFAPLPAQRMVVLCGKGNNGGDGLVVARQLHTRFHPQALDVVLLAAPEELKGDAAANYQMLAACGCPVWREIPAEARLATLVVDALLGTGISGPATGAMLEGIREINGGFPLAKVVAVDIPSGMPSDSGEPVGEFARADYTVTFTAPKVGQVLPPNCDGVGELVVAGSREKSGAAAMAGLGALRAGAGLVTVASAASAIPVIAAHAPELMTAPIDDLDHLVEGKTVIAMGPGLGRGPDIEALVTRAVAEFAQPMVLDADALVGHAFSLPGRVRVLTPHPGEMARLTGKTTAEIQNDRVGAARAFAMDRHVTLVLKGQRTVIAFPDGRVWINPTGTPAMGTGGSGDVLTGMIAGFLAQSPSQPDQAVAAAVYLHGLAGEIGARALGEKCLIATDILRYLPDAMEECADVSDGV